MKFYIERWSSGRDMREKGKVEVFAHHGDSPPVCQQVWEWLKKGGEVGKWDEISYPDKLDPDSLLAVAMLFYVQEEGVIPEVEKLVEEVAAADLGRGLLFSKGAKALRIRAKWGLIPGRFPPQPWELERIGDHEEDWDIWTEDGEIEKRAAELSAAREEIEKQDRESQPVLLPCGEQVVVLQGGNAKLVTWREAKIVITPYLDGEGKQAYSISSPDEGADLAPVLEALNREEPGWSGNAMPGGILEYSKSGHTRMALMQIIEICIGVRRDENFREFREWQAEHEYLLRLTGKLEEL